MYTWKEITYPSLSSVTDRVDDRLGGTGEGQGVGLRLSTIILQFIGAGHNDLTAQNIS